MLKVEMVRCYVVSPLPQSQNPEGLGRQVRYIPLEIFRLWKYIMVSVKGFQVVDEVISFWMDEEEYNKESAGYSSHEVEKVVQVYFQYHKDMQGGRPVIRYFPSEHFQSIMQFFMQNFSSHHIKRDVEQTSGIFIVPNP